MLSDRCLSCPVCPVCNGGVLWPHGGWIKMKLGMEVGLRTSRVALEWTHVNPKKGRQPRFWPMSLGVKRLDGSRCHLVRR